jgi:hypothetical protein
VPLEENAIGIDKRFGQQRFARLVGFDRIHE